MENHENIPEQKSNGQEADRSIAAAIVALQEFRQNLYNYFSHRADAIMELIDALASNYNARSVVELSLSSLFRREHSSIYDAIEHLFDPSKPENATQEQRVHEQGLLRLIAPLLPAPEQGKYWLFGTDLTYLPRQFADVLADRTYMHWPNTIVGNKPVTIGHDYSILSYLPEKASTWSPPWLVPLIVRRVESTEKASQSALSSTDIEALAQKVFEDIRTQALDPEDADLIRATLSSSVHYGDMTLDLPTLHAWLRARVSGRWQSPTLVKVQPIDSTDHSKTNAFIREVLAAHPEDYASPDGWQENTVEALKALLPPKRRGLLSELLTPQSISKAVSTPMVADTKKAKRRRLGL
ncbi:MAG: transposase [Chloroflexi bacterium]|nr:transposase [Chloroflexota bacterium]